MCESYSPEGTVAFEGDIEEDHLVLDSCSHITGHRAFGRVFRFACVK
jgi:hypothetical protein